MAEMATTTLFIKSLEAEAPSQLAVAWLISSPDFDKVTKFLLKKSMHNILPRDIIYRKKQGYNAPMDAWFKGPLKESLEHLIEQRSHSFYDPAYITQVLKKFQNAGNDYRMNFYNAQKLWSMYMFETWHKIFIDGVPPEKMTL